MTLEDILSGMHQLKDGHMAAVVLAIFFISLLSSFCLSTIIEKFQLPINSERKDSLFQKFLYHWVFTLTLGEKVQYFFGIGGIVASSVAAILLCIARESTPLTIFMIFNFIFDAYLAIAYLIKHQRRYTQKFKIDSEVRRRDNIIPYSYLEERRKVREKAEKEDKKRQKIAKRRRVLGTKP